MTTPGGLLLVFAVLAPFTGMLAALALGGHRVMRVAAVTLAAGLGLAVAAALSYLEAGQPLVYLLGGWAPALGIAFRADALSIAMLVAVAVVIGGIMLYALADFRLPAGKAEARGPYTFWILLLAVWGALNLVLVSGDLFTLYVALELLTFAGVPLVCLDGSAGTLRSALRYLLFALAGSVFYLLGAVLLYGAYGTLDIPLLASVAGPGPATWTAAALMTTGLLAKTALFPLHIWLPPAHSGAPAAASAILSALVIKGSWFLAVRLWFDALPGVVTPAAGQLLGGMGAVVIVIGSLVALRQVRLKLLVAYSTLAQIGYLFLMFPLGFDPGGSTMVHGAALTGGLLQAISHATAKAGMFMAAGLVYAALGHDKIANLAGVARAMPVTVAAFGLAGLALMGVVPSGAYLAKKLLLGAAGESGQWWWTLVLQGGAAFTAGYVVLMLASTLRTPAGPAPAIKAVPRVAELAALSLAVASLALAFAAGGPLPGELLKNPLEPAELGTTALVLLGGTLLALGLARRSPRARDGAASADGPFRQVAVAIGIACERTDEYLRRWPSAGISLLLVALLFGVLLA